MKTFIDYLNENKIESVMKIDQDSGKFWVIPNTGKHKLSYYGLGILHNEDGPAIEWSDGSKLWFINGKLHREDGPASEHNVGAIYWYLNNEQIEPTYEMMSKYIRLNPENIFKNYEWPKEIQELAIKIGGEKIKLELIKKRLLHPDLYGKLDNLNKRGFFN